MLLLLLLLLLLLCEYERERERERRGVWECMVSRGSRVVYMYMYIYSYENSECSLMTGLDLAIISRHGRIVK